MEDGQKEKYIPTSPESLSIEGTKKILEQMQNSVCKIYNEAKGTGTGFFIKIPYKSNLLSVLVTACHVINKSDINKSITITLNDDNYKKSLKIDNERMIYTNEKLDVTFIEIKEKDNINNYLELDDEIKNCIFSNNENFYFLKNIYSNKSIYSINYPNGKKVVVSYAQSPIFYENNNNFLHKCSTLYGSSGAPILLIENQKVIGIHLSADYQNLNKASLIIDSINEFQKNENNIFNNDNLTAKLIDNIKKIIRNKSLENKFSPMSNNNMNNNFNINNFCQNNNNNMNDNQADKNFLINIFNVKSVKVTKNKQIKFCMNNQNQINMNNQNQINMNNQNQINMNNQNLINMNNQKQINMNNQNLINMNNQNQINMNNQNQINMNNQNQINMNNQNLINMNNLNLINMNNQKQINMNNQNLINMNNLNLINMNNLNLINMNNQNLININNQNQINMNNKNLISINNQNQINMNNQNLINNQNWINVCDQNQINMNNQNQISINKQNHINMNEPNLISKNNQNQININDQAQNILFNNFSLNSIYLFSKKGLTNIGYNHMSVTFQCLLHVSELNIYFLNIYPKEKNTLNEKNKFVDSHGQVSDAFYELVKGVCEDELKRQKVNPSNISVKDCGQPFSLRNFKKILSNCNSQFKLFDFNNIKDLILYLMQTIHKELNYCGDNISSNLSRPNQYNRRDTFKFFMGSYNSHNYSIISYLFYGTYEDKTLCKKCNTILYNFHKFEFVSFKTLYYKNKIFNIYNGFEDNSKPQQLNGKNKFYCNYCKNLEDAELTTKIIQPPNKLLINIDYGKNKAFKPSNINFEEIIDLTKYIDFDFGAPIRYSLISVCTYLASSGNFAQYVAYCKHKETGEWYNFNDSTCKSCNKSDIYGGSPYLLLYEKIK